MLTFERFKIQIFTSQAQKLTTKVEKWPPVVSFQIIKRQCAQKAAH